jgi:two-component system NtrC family sensor kinase
MNQSLQFIIEYLNQIENVSIEVKEELIKSAKKVKSDLEIAEFKLERTEKVKRTTSILLEETIEELEQKRKAIEVTNVALEQSLKDLKATQSQLIQSEKMASLGELTAGIAHEIQNPLNFVNNFSEVSAEIIQEIIEERAKNKEERYEALVDEIIADISKNLEKINLHGNRASSIVKGMLEHSRTSSGQKELVDINALADEYLKLSYHGLRAKDKSFNVTLKTDFDKSIGSINIIPLDIGRVILNLINNAFYAVNEKQKADSLMQKEESYKPLVTISTKNNNEKLEITISDNGNGIPQNIIDKIFQPFFTTKPTGKGTGLGLSLAYDIVKAHGGELKVETREGEGTEFCITLA